MRSRKSTHLHEVLAVFALLMALVFAQPALAEHTYSDDQAKLKNYERQIDEIQERIHHLIAEKRRADEKNEIKHLVEQIAESYKQLKKASHDHEAMWLHIRFKHPEQASSLEKRYTRFKLKSLDEMEAEVGIDGRLDRIKAKVLATFPAPELVKEQKDESKVHPFYRRPASVDDDAPEEIKLSK